MAYRDEDNMLDQIYEEQIFPDFYYEDSKYKMGSRERIFKEIQHTTTRNLLYWVLVPLD